MQRSKRAADLEGDLDCFCGVEPDVPANLLIQRDALHKFHSIENLSVLLAQVSHGGDVWVTDCRRHARFALKALSGYLIAQKIRGDDLERDMAMQVCIECFVSDTHRSTSQNTWGAVSLERNFEMPISEVLDHPSREETIFRKASPHNAALHGQHVRSQRAPSR